MNDSLYERMRRGERELAATMEASLQSRDVVARVRRRRTVTAVALATAALAVVGTGATSALAWWPDAASVGDLSAASGTPSPPSSPSASASPAPAEPETPEVYGAAPETVDGLPVLVQASSQVADATLTPRPGPDFVPGQRRPLADVLHPGALARCADDWCGMAPMPAITKDVLDSEELTAVINEWAVIDPSVETPGDLDYLVAAGPSTGAYMAVDLSGWAKDEGFQERFGVQDLAADPSGHRIAAVLQEYVSGGEGVDPTMVVIFDLNTGTSTVLAEGLDHASIEWAGDQWRVYGYGPEGTLGALVASDASRWTTQGVQVARGWWMSEERGYTELYGQNWWTRAWLFDGELYPVQPDGTSMCNPAYAVSESEGYVRASCESLGADGPLDPSAMGYYQLTAGEGWAPLDPALASQAPPHSTSFGALGDGYVLWRGGQPIYLEDGTETTLDLPTMEPWAGHLADGGLWLEGDGGLGWLSPSRDFTKVMDFSTDTTFADLYPYGVRPAS